MINPHVHRAHLEGGAYAPRAAARPWQMLRLIADNGIGQAHPEAEAVRCELRRATVRR